jgi:hypothetical protein
MNKDYIASDLTRFREINRYTEKLIKEQTEPLDSVDPTAVPDPTATDPTATNPTVAPESITTPTGSTENAPMPEVEPNIEDDTTEEIDITDLVNMTKSIKQSLDTKVTDPMADQGKMDEVFGKLNDLEQKLSLMDTMIQRIEELGGKIDEMKPPTPIEKLEMRSLDSYPFNQKPDEFFNQKQAEMRKTGKNEYVLTKNDVENYSKNQISNSFNPNRDRDDQTTFSF